MGSWRRDGKAGNGGRQFEGVTAITGFNQANGFNPTAAYTLGYVVSLLKANVPVVYGEIADAQVNTLQDDGPDAYAVLADEDDIQAGERAFQVRDVIVEIVESREEQHRGGCSFFLREHTHANTQVSEHCTRSWAQACGGGSLATNSASCTAVGLWAVRT